MSTEWYYAKDNQQLGPIPPSQLKTLAQSGQLSPDDLVWKEGMAEWQPAGKIKGLFDPGMMPATATAVAHAAAAGAARQPAAQQPQQYGSPQPQMHAQPQSSIGYYNPTAGLGARTAEIMKGMPTPTGPQNEWPLSDHHLEQFKQTETHRKPIRTCAGLLNVLFILYLIASIIFVLMALFATSFAPRGGRGGGAVAWAQGFMIGLAAAIVGLTFLAFFASRATLKCRMWGAIVFLVLFCLGILLNLVGMFMSASATGGGPELIGGVFSMVLPIIFAVVCLRAILAIPKFLASPVWCQEALINAKL